MFGEMWISAAGASNSRRRLRGRLATPRQRWRGHDSTNSPLEALPRLSSLGGHGNGALLQDAIPGRQYLSASFCGSWPSARRLRFSIFNYSYTLFLYTTPYLLYSILLSGIYIFALKADRKIRAVKLPLYPDPRKRTELPPVV